MWRTYYGVEWKKKKGYNNTHKILKDRKQKKRYLETKYSNLKYGKFLYWLTINIAYTKNEIMVVYILKLHNFIFSYDVAPTFDSVVEFIGS